MNLTQVSATERFDEVILDNVVEDGRATSFYTCYTCPSCQEKLRFTRADFESRGRRTTSNLSPELSLAFTALASSTKFADSEYLDWHCPGCKMSVRLYFQQWAGGRHGDSGVELQTIIEFQRDKANAL